MAWVRIDDNAPHHRKMLQAGPAACWLWVCGLAYCQRMSTDGFIPIEALPALGVLNWKKPCNDLQVAGLWHAVTGGYQVHDYLSWNATKEERQAQAQAHKDRTAKWRAGKRDVSPQTNGDESVTRHTESSVTLLPSPPLLSTPDLSVPINRSDLGRAVPVSPARAPLITSPKEWDKTHGTHVDGFCDWCCFPRFLFNQFCTSADWDEAQTLIWARSVRETWPGGARGDELKFWRARWDERHPQTKATTKGAQIVASGKAWAERYDREHSS